MRAKRRKFTAAFKAQVVIEALKERLTLSEISTKFEVHHNMISKWKQEFLERAPEIFEGGKEPKEDFDAERDRLHAKIGELEMQRDWLKKISKKAGL